MTMTRVTDQAGLSSGPGWTEFGFATGNEDWALARLRVTPEIEADAARVHQPNAVAVPSRVAVLLSASLIDAEGAVLTVAGRLLVGPESRHAYQFDADAAFDPAGWLDGRAEAVIAPLIRLATGLTAAQSAGLLPE